MKRDMTFFFFGCSIFLCSSADDVFIFLLSSSGEFAFFLSFCRKFGSVGTGIIMESCGRDRVWDFGYSRGWQLEEGD